MLCVDFGLGVVVVRVRPILLKMKEKGEKK